MADFLTEMVGASKQRARSLKSADSPRTDDIVPVRPMEIERSGFDLIAEAKLAGPATGRLLQPPEECPARNRAVGWGTVRNALSRAGISSCTSASP